MSALWIGHLAPEVPRPLVRVHLNKVPPALVPPRAVVDVNTLLPLPMPAVATYSIAILPGISRSSSMDMPSHDSFSLYSLVAAEPASGAGAG